MHQRPPISPLFPYTTLFRSLFRRRQRARDLDEVPEIGGSEADRGVDCGEAGAELFEPERGEGGGPDRKSTRLNSSHSQISYAVFCLKKKMIERRPTGLLDWL